MCGKRWSVDGHFSVVEDFPLFSTLFLRIWRALWPDLLVSSLRGQGEAYFRARAKFPEGFMGERFTRRSVLGGMALETANLLFFRSVEATEIFGAAEGVPPVGNTHL